MNNLKYVFNKSVLKPLFVFLLIANLFLGSILPIFAQTSSPNTNELDSSSQKNNELPEKYKNTQISVVKQNLQVNLSLQGFRNITPQMSNIHELILIIYKDNEEKEINFSTSTIHRNATVDDAKYLDGSYKFKIKIKDSSLKSTYGSDYLYLSSSDSFLNDQLFNASLHKTISLEEEKKNTESEKQNESTPPVQPSIPETSPKQPNETNTQTEIPVKDINDLFKTKSDDRLLILFEGQPFRIHLKEGNHQKRLERAMMKRGPKNKPKFKPLNGKNNEEGLFFGIKALAGKDHSYFTLASDNVDEKDLVGRYSGELVLKYKGEKRRHNTGKLSFIRLKKPKNLENKIYYVNSGNSLGSFSQEDLLSQIKLIYGDIDALASKEELAKLPKWKQDNLKKIHQEKMADKQELTALFEEKQENSNDYKYKIISEVTKDGQKVEIDDLYTKPGKYIVKVKFINPSYVLDHNNQTQTIIVEQPVEVRDVKTPFKKIFTDKFDEAIKYHKDKLENLNLDSDEQKLRELNLEIEGTLLRPYKEILDGLESEKERISSKIEYEESPALDAQISLDKYNSVKEAYENKVKREIDLLLAVSDVVAEANSHLDFIKNTNLTSSEKEKYIANINLYKQISDINDHFMIDNYDADALKSFINNYNDYLAKQREEMEIILQDRDTADVFKEMYQDILSINDFSKITSEQKSMIESALSDVDTFDDETKIKLKDEIEKLRNMLEFANKTENSDSTTNPLTPPKPESKPSTPEVTPITPSPTPSTPVQPKPEPKTEVKPETKVITHNPNWQQDLRKHNEFISKHNKETNKTLPNTGHINNHSILLASTLLTLVAYKLYKKED